MTQTDQDPGPIAGLMAKVSAYIEIGAAQTLQTKKLVDRLNKPPAQPVFWKESKGVTIDAAGNGIATLRGPDSGYMWYLRSIVVGGEAWGTTAAGTCELYVSAMDLRQFGDNAPPLSELLDQATSLPLLAFYGDGDIELRYPEKLFARFTGATAAQQYIAAARFEQFQEGVSAQTWDM